MYWGEKMKGYIGKFGLVWVGVVCVCLLIGFCFDKLLLKLVEGVCSFWNSDINFELVWIGFGD